MMDSRLAFVFPGQGSHSVGMLADLAARYPLIEETFATASQALGYDLWELCQNGPEAELNLTHKTQPAMLAAGVALWRVWQAQSTHRPAMMAGHSLGEITALVCAEALDFSAAIKMLAARGQYMQEAVPANEGAMAAILGLEDEQVNEVCQQAAQGEIVAPANFNSPGQVVVAGHVHAVQRAVELSRQKGAKRAVFLAVSVPVHCILMWPAAMRLADYLQDVEFKSPRIPVVNNVDVCFQTEPDALRDALVRQGYCPVRWSDCVRHMTQAGIRTVIECGPGKVLTGLARRIDPGLQALSIGSLVGLEQVLADRPAP